MKKIALVGSTGSIGRQVINVARRHSDKFSVVALIADQNAAELSRQVALIKPKCAALCSGANVEVPDGTAYFTGEDAGLCALEECGADVVVVACGGFAGLKYSLKAIELNLPLALANKETLVCGGELVMPRVKEIMPVDSEHSAIWQCLGFNRLAPFKRLIITASGGASRGKRWSELSGVTPEQALAHPTWKMGAKITVDSATLLNKGYEIIEAHHLYNAPYERMEAVIHPQSIVHSMVEFDDGAVIAQLSYPTMELPIQLALTYPERVDVNLRPLDFKSAFSLGFLPLNGGEYPLFDLALACGKEGGVLPTALNAASEVAVGAFLSGTLGYTDIFTVADRVVCATKNTKADDYEVLKEVDRLSRLKAAALVKGGGGG